jgi:hypothetical protein
MLLSAYITLIKVDIKITYQLKNTLFYPKLISYKASLHVSGQKSVLKQSKQKIHQGKYDKIETDLFLF